MVKERSRSATTNTVGIGGLDVLHMRNFANAIRKGDSPHRINELQFLLSRVIVVDYARELIQRGSLVDPFRGVLD